MEALEGKVALITGGSRGLGKAIAKLFVHEGARVALAARRGALLRSAADEAAAEGERPITVICDVREESSVLAMFERVVDTFGRLDILINSAGAGWLGTTLEASVNDWDEVMNVNARGTFLCCREAVRQMLTQESRGQIINIISFQGIDSRPRVGVYGASKHAAIALTRSLAQEVQPDGIRVTALCPMPTDTEMRRELTPDRDLSSYLLPAEIAEAALFMATRPFSAGIQELIVGLNRRWGGIG